MRGGGRERENNKIRQSGGRKERNPYSDPMMYPRGAVGGLLPIQRGERRDMEGMERKEEAAWTCIRSILLILLPFPFFSFFSFFRFSVCRFAFIIGNHNGNYGGTERAGVEPPSCMYAMPRDDYDSDYYDYDYDYYDYCPEEVSRCRHRHVGPRFVHVTAIGPIYVENTLNADIIIGDKSSQKPTIQRSIIVLTSKLAAILVQCVIYA